MTKIQFIWLTKKIDQLYALRHSGISKEFDDLVERTYWKFFNLRSRALEDSKYGVLES